MEGGSDKIGKDAAVSAGPKKAKLKKWTRQDDVILNREVDSMIKKGDFSWNALADTMTQILGLAAEEYQERTPKQYQEIYSKDILDEETWYENSKIGRQWQIIKHTVGKGGRTDTTVKNRYYSRTRMFKEEMKKMCVMDKNKLRSDRLDSFTMKLLENHGKMKKIFPFGIDYIEEVIAQTLIDFCDYREKLGAFRKARGEECSRCLYLAPSPECDEWLHEKTGWCLTCSRTPPEIYTDLLFEVLSWRRNTAETDPRIQQIAQQILDTPQDGLDKKYHFGPPSALLPPSSQPRAASGFPTSERSRGAAAVPDTSHSAAFSPATNHLSTDNAMSTVGNKRSATISESQCGTDTGAILDIPVEKKTKKGNFDSDEKIEFEGVLSMPRVGIRNLTGQCQVLNDVDTFSGKGSSSLDVTSDCAPESNGLGNNHTSVRQLTSVKTIIEQHGIKRLGDYRTIVERNGIRRAHHFFMDEYRAICWKSVGTIFEEDCNDKYAFYNKLLNTVWRGIADYRRKKYSELEKAERTRVREAAERRINLEEAEQPDNGPSRRASNGGRGVRTAPNTVQAGRLEGDPKETTLANCGNFAHILLSLRQQST